MNNSFVCDKIAEAAKTHDCQTQCHSPVGDIFLMELSLDDIASPRATRLAMSTEHSQDSQDEAVQKPPIIFLFEGPGLSVRFQ